MEYSKKNLAALNAALAPPCYESSQESSEARNDNEVYSTVESLMQLFTVRLEAAQDNSGIEIMSQLNSEYPPDKLRVLPYDK